MNGPTRYSEFGQITQDRQAHAGAADASSPRVAYEYENGSANHVRLKKIVYPTTTRFLEPLYGTGDQNDLLSRVKQLRFTKSGAVVVADYSYLGLDRPVVVDYPEPDVKLNLASGSGHYPYTGLDQFDRLLQALWQYYGSPNADREKVVYGYDLAGNRLTRDNQLSGSGGQDEKYAYDGLWQVSTLDRGTLSGGNITSKVFAQAWTFDQTGNWANFKQDDNGDGTWELNQNRTHNLANEIATIQVWGAVVHDPVGNMTRIPKPSSPANRYACIWDAWNRLVEVKETDGSGNPTTTVAVYAYDGFYRRTKKVIGASTRDYYYSLGWQVIEERVGGALDRQFVWGIRHIDDLVLRDRGAEGLYAVHDAMHVTAVTNAAGAVQERYGYEGFGKPRFMDTSFGARASSSFDWETLFDGYRFDTETGLYQVRFRYLHPGLGRWISRDPIGELAGDNQYALVGNDPPNGTDPTGLQVIWWISRWWKHFKLDLEWDKPFGALADTAWRLEAEHMPSGHAAHGGGFAHCVFHCMYKRRAGDLASRLAVAFHNCVFENPNGPLGDWSDPTSPTDRIANQAGAEAADDEGSCVDECKKRYPPI